VHCSLELASLPVLALQTLALRGGLVARR